MKQNRKSGSKPIYLQSTGFNQRVNRIKGTMDLAWPKFLEMHR